MLNDNNTHIFIHFFKFTKQARRKIDNLEIRINISHPCVKQRFSARYKFISL